MKKIAITLIALAGISSAALAAGNHSGDLRDSPTYFGKYAEAGKTASGASGNVSTDALAVPAGISGVSHGSSNFDRLNQRALERTEGDR